jgi:hypothetical protein
LTRFDTGALQRIFGGRLEQFETGLAATTPYVVCWCIIERERHAFSCESGTGNCSTLQQRRSIMAKKTKKKVKAKKKK